MIGGYATVAGELNKRFGPQPPVDRRNVYAWHKFGRRNAAGDFPPAAVEVREGVPRTQARFLFDTEQWVWWFAKGVPGPRRRGWLRWAEVSSQPGMKV